MTDTITSHEENIISQWTKITLADGTEILAPWGFRNSGMGGRHTEKEYPESNIYDPGKYSH